VSRPARIAALTTAIALGTLALSRFWYTHPDLFPRALWSWLDGAGGADAGQNLEFLAVVATSLVVISIAAYVVLRTWRWLASTRRRHA